MARRDATLDALNRLTPYRTEPTTPEATAAFRDALASGSGRVVEKAAAMVADAFADGRVADASGWAAAYLPLLASACARLFKDPLRTDKGSFGKAAAVSALDRMGYDDATPFLHAVTYRQWEPVMGGRADTAGTTRAHAVAALVRLRHPTRLEHVADLLWDPQQDARLGAVRAAVFEGTDEAALLLRAKAWAGDKGSDLAAMAWDGGAEVMAAVFSGLLSIRGEGNAPFVARFLTERGPTMEVSDAVREQAALSLGESRTRGGVEALTRAWKGAVDSEAKRVVIAGMLLNGTEEAVDVLSDWLREASGTERRLICSAAKEVFGETGSRYQRLLSGAGEA